MLSRLRGVWIDLVQNLFFVPLAVVLVVGGFGVGLVELDKSLELTGSTLVFNGDTGAARTVLSVIAGSLITVAGLTFSITIVVLQLASSQFSPRILRTFFGDRLTQVTIGAFVGVFVYAILVLRAVGSPEDVADFVPRIAITVGSLLSIVAVVLLIGFLQHVSKLVQASHVAGHIGHVTLQRTDALYPDTGEPVGEPEHDVVSGWRGQPSAPVRTDRPGFVQRVASDGLEDLGGDLERIAFTVVPGDFVALGDTVAELWPHDAGDDALARVRAQVAVADERDLHQDVDFGLRQLTDMAVKAMSPGINDPTTAVTCVGYVRSVLTVLAGRAEPPQLRRVQDTDLEVHLPSRDFAERLDCLLEIGRYAASDARVVVSLLQALEAVAAAALEAGAGSRAAAACDTARAVAEQASRRQGSALEEEAVSAALARAERAAGYAASTSS